MNSNIQEQIDLTEKDLLDNRNNLAEIKDIFADKEFKLSDSSCIWISSDTVYIHVYNREDLQAVLSVAPMWEKKHGATSIAYTNKIGNITIKIFANDAALPSTCQLVEEEVFIEATEARTELRTVLKCNLPDKS